MILYKKSILNQKSSQFANSYNIYYNFSGSYQCVMRPTHRVERNTAIPFHQAYRSSLGITSIDSYLYVFYPNTIRVYEQFPQKSFPQLTEELIISHRKIIKFAVSKQFIVVLLEDAKLEVRLRQYWEVVQYSLNLEQDAHKIDQLTLIGEKIIYRVMGENSERDIYAFITASLKPKETQTQTKAQIVYLTSQYEFDKLIHLKQLGSINYFYVGLVRNEIKFGMYYSPENVNNFKQFQFGTIKNDNPAHQILMISMRTPCRWEYSEKSASVMTHSSNLYLVKLLKYANNEDQKNRIIIKYQKFYDQIPNQEGQLNKQLDAQAKRLQIYTKMMHTLQQIQLNTNCISSNSNLLPASANKTNNAPLACYTLQQPIQIQLQPNQYYTNAIEYENKLYFATNRRIFWLQIVEFINKSQNKTKVTCKYTQVYRLENGSRLQQVCKDVLYITGINLYAVSMNHPTEDQQNGKDKEIIAQKNNGKKIYERESRHVGINQQIQTEVSSDVLLDQYEEKQMKQMIDYLLEKKNVVDTQAQTQNLPQDSNNGIQKDQKGLSPQISNKSSNEISIGENLPICPVTHQEILQKINKNLKQIQTNSQKQIIQNLNEIIKKEQQKIKDEIVKKIEELIQSTVSNAVVPLIQSSVRQILQTKLQEVNVYIYTLSMQNLLQMKQEIQKDQVKQNMLRTELIKKQLHQITEGKKAVTQMIEICKKREMQKIVFFEEMKAKFNEMEQKVLNLEGKMKALIEGEQVNEAKIFDQIQVIKTMLKTQDPVFQQIRKKSMISHHEKDIVSEEEQQKGEKQQNSQESQEQDQLNQEDEIEQDEEYEEPEKMVMMKKKIIQPPPGMMNNYRHNPYMPINYPPPPPQYYRPYQMPYQQCVPSSGYPPPSPIPQYPYMQSPVYRKYQTLDPTLFNLQTQMLSLEKEDKRSKKLSKEKKKKIKGN